MITAAQRTDLGYLAGVLINHAKQVDYPEHDVRTWQDTETFNLTRPAALERLRKGGVLLGDCSGIITCLFKWANLDDPNGLAYAHEGYTGTMLAHLPHYRNAAYAMVGALAVFGPGTGEHVAMVIERGHDPVLFSHGSRGVCGPIRLSVEARYHKSPVTFLNIAQLG